MRLLTTNGFIKSTNDCISFNLDARYKHLNSPDVLVTTIVY